MTPDNPYLDGTDQGAAIVSPNMSDGAIHTAKIAYVADSLQVFVDDSLYLDLSIDLDALLDLDNGTAFVGFAAGGATATENHDITEWTFTSGESVPEPSTFAALAGLSLMGLPFVRRRRRKA